MSVDYSNGFTQEQLEMAIVQAMPECPDVSFNVAELYDNTTNEHNITYDVIGTTDCSYDPIMFGEFSRWAGSISRGRMGVRVYEPSVSPNTHYCLVRIPTKPFFRYTYYYDRGIVRQAYAPINVYIPTYVLVTNSANIQFSESTKKGYLSNRTITNHGTPQDYQQGPDTLSTLSNEYGFKQLSQLTALYGGENNQIPEEYHEYIDALSALSGYAVFNLPSNSYASNFCGGVKTGQNWITMNLSTTLPRFDITATDDIADFLATGNTEHAIYDDDTPETPYRTRVENVATHVVMYCDKDVIPLKSAFEVTISNGDVDQMPVSSQRLYFMENYIGDYGETQIGGRSSYRASRRDVWGDITPVSGQGNLWIKFISTNPLDEELEFGRWWLRYRLSEKKASGIELLAIPSMVDRTISQTGTITTDTYTQFTYSDGSTFTIYFYPKRDEDTDDGFIHKPNGSGTDSASEVDILDAYGIGTYNIGSNGLSDVNRYLWGNSWATLFQAINPITCITSCKQIPFNKSGNAVTSIPIANKTCDVSASKINPVGVFNVMSNATLSPLYHSFLDVSHTRVFVYLPFCGWHELPTSEVMTTDNYTRVIKVDYIVDFITGGCRAVVYVNGIHKWDFDGNCGENIPLTSNDKGNADRNAFIGGLTSFVGGIDSVAKGFAVGGYAGAIVSGIGATANTVVNSIPKYSYSSTGSYSGLIEACSPRNISFVIVRPDVQEPIGYAHKYGKPCHLVKRLGDLKGFTSCVNPDFDSAYATESEKAEVISLLQSGIIL